MSESAAAARKVEVFAPSSMRADTDARLIAAVRARRSLYDNTHARYMDNNHKVDVWRDIGEQLKANPTACKARWNNIRDNYRKSLRRRPGERVRISKYKYAQQLAFMTKFLRATCASDEDDDERNDDDDKDNDEDDDAALKRASAVNVPCEFSAVKVDNSDEQQESMVDYELFDKKEPVGLNFPVYPSSMHPIDAFLAGISPTLKAMSPYHLSLAKAEIFAAVHKYEMKGIVEGSGWARDANPLP